MAAAVSEPRLKMAATVPEVYPKMATSISEPHPKMSFQPPFQSFVPSRPPPFQSLTTPEPILMRESAETLLFLESALVNKALTIVAMAILCGLNTHRPQPRWPSPRPIQSLRPRWPLLRQRICRWSLSPLLPISQLQRPARPLISVTYFFVVF